MSCRLRAHQARKSLTEQEKLQGKAARLSIMTQESFQIMKGNKAKYMDVIQRRGTFLGCPPAHVDCRVFVRRRRDATHFSGSCARAPDCVDERSLWRHARYALVCSPRFCSRRVAGRGHTPPALRSPIPFSPTQPSMALPFLRSPRRAKAGGVG